ncbi:hypothetical protein SAMN04488490_0099 [Marinobacter sp. LV10R510-11A]|uniref:hypothetical protein n=1 Tax=Marinobacter sp. LV10R510-11A TaxID=1415568 RepID=UPI000BB822EA|nr:hypothetical protein [Marinobacter sp. LV10R510-11A]SOB74610.1 hypothetical protein SAMN04488490_0099 [Marinobacter sp. LV10R510-11A]
MSFKRITEEELLKGLDAHTAHADELANPLANEMTPPEHLEIQLTNQHGVVALRWIIENQQQFGLSIQDVQKLTGAKSVQNIHAWLSEIELVPEGSIRRLGLLLGIYRGLVEATPSGQEKLAFDWFQRKSHLFAEFPGQSIRDYVLDNPTEKVLKTVCSRIRSLSR